MHDLTAIRRAMTPPAPTLEQLRELEQCAVQRHARACAKLAVAEAEEDAAEDHLRRARAMVAQFIADNPDPQLAIPGMDQPA